MPFFGCTCIIKHSTILELYHLGNSVYDNNRFNEAASHFEAALNIVKIPSFYISLGNSYFVTSDFRKALTTCQAALKAYRVKKDSQGEGNALGNMGLAYYALGQYNKAIEYYSQALATFEEIKSPYAEQVRKVLAELEAGGK